MENNFNNMHDNNEENSEEISEDEAYQALVKKVEKKKNAGKKRKSAESEEQTTSSNPSTVSKHFRWTESMIEDMVDLILNSDKFKKYLILENNKRANGPYYESLVTGLNSRILNYEDPGPTVTAAQARNKFKALLSECKALALTKKTASGIERARVERGYGNWFSKLYEIVSTRPSFNPAKNIEPSFPNDEPQTMEEEDNPLQETLTSAEAPRYVPRREEDKKGKKGFQQRLLEQLDKITKNDPTENILKFIREENERSRQHETLMMDKLLQLCSPHQSIPSQSIPSQTIPSQRTTGIDFIHSPTYQQTTYAPPEKHVPSSISPPPAHLRTLHRTNLPPNHHQHLAHLSPPPPNLSFTTHQWQNPSTRSGPRHSSSISSFRNQQQQSSCDQPGQQMSPPFPRFNFSNASHSNHQQQLSNNYSNEELPTTYNDTTEDDEYVEC